MKRKMLKKAIISVLAIAMAVTLLPSAGNVDAAAKAKLSKKSVSLTVGAKKTIKVTGKSIKKVTWKSSKKSVAAVKKKGAKDSTKLFFSGVLVLTAANLLVKVIGLLFKIPMSNKFGDTMMGYYNSAYMIYTVFYMVSTAGLPVAVSIMISESRAKGKIRQIKRVFWVTVGLFFAIGLIGMAILFFGAESYSINGLKAEPTKYSIMVIAPMLFFICISSSIRGYFQGFQQMVPTAVSELIESFCKLAVGLVMAMYAADRYPGQHHIIAAYAAVGLTVGAGLSMLYLVIAKLLFKQNRYTAEFLEKCGGEDRRVDPASKILKRLAMIALPITISSSVMSLANLVDSVLVQRILQKGGLFFEAMTQEQATQAYGNYTTKAVSMFNLPPVLIYPISCSIIPLISAAREQGDTKRVRTILSSALRVSVLIGAPCALGLVALSKPILSLFFTKASEVDLATPLLRILAPSTFFVCMLAVMTAILQSSKKERLPLVAMLAGVVVKVIASFILIRIIGMPGTPISTFVCYLVICSIDLHFCCKYAGLELNFTRDFVRPIFCAAICALSAFGAYTLFSELHPGRIATLASIFVAAVVYVVVIFVFKAITRDDVMLIPKGAKLCRVLEKLKLLRD